jgi:type II secretory pathway component PulL
MARAYPALLLGRTKWRLALAQDESVVLEEGGDWHQEEPTTAATEIANALEVRALSHFPLAILLESDITYVAHWKLDSPRQLRRTSALLYELEEHLPLAAEDLTATYLRRDLDLMAIATDQDEILSLVSALQGNGIQVDLVMPIMPLAAWSHRKSRRAASEEVVVWLGICGTANHLRLIDGKPTLWQYLPHGSAQLGQQLTYDQLSRPGAFPLTVYHNGNSSDDLLQSFRSISGAELVHRDADPLALGALEALTAVRQGKEEPATAFKGVTHGGRAQEPLRWELRLLQLAVASLLIALAVMNWHTAQDRARERAELQVASEDVFREVLPGATLRTGVRSRLESELAKLSGVKGGKNEEGISESVLPMLYQLLSVLPEDMRFRLLEVRLDGRQLHLTGEVREFSDADRIAAALRAKGLAVTPPTTQRLPVEGVSFRMVAQLADKENSHGK